MKALVSANLQCQSSVDCAESGFRGKHVLVWVLEACWLVWARRSSSMRVSGSVKIILKPHSDHRILATTIAGARPSLQLFKS